MIYIILPVFKRVELTRRFIESVRETKRDDVLFIIVDDEISVYSSFDSFIDDKDVVVLKTAGDVWWCKTVSAGIDYLFSNIPSDKLLDDTVIIANNDVQVPSDIFNMLGKLDDNCIIHPTTKLVATNEIVSSGCKVKSWLPFITEHPKNRDGLTVEVDMLTARFLCMKGSVLLKNGNINTELLQYHGDSEFTLRARSKGIKNYIVADFVVTLDDNDNSAINQKSVLSFLNSVFDETKSNSIKQKFIFLRANFGFVKSLIITLNMTINGFAKVLLRKCFGS